ncbi:myosin-cross-reactive antigen [Rhodococcus opacus M213]|uniref:Myosin-cross-reactive antigen n=1 Tax=Rhodococcus opacus M213 TaxID=1129896 RepID=K8XKP1_RHOOP|nr:myosin-cross-reactive antigen [Rhodococcus opacus M213]
MNTPLRGCTGEEITQQLVYPLGVPVDEFSELSELAAHTAKRVRMPYSDLVLHATPGRCRPDVVPEGAVNFAFIGQFAETTRECIFTTEYVGRTMKAAYQLLGSERGVPAVFNSPYDVHALRATTSNKLPRRTGSGAARPRLLRKKLMAKLDATEIGDHLREPKLLSD